MCTNRQCRATNTRCALRSVVELAGMQMWADSACSCNVTYVRTQTSKTIEIKIPVKQFRRIFVLPPLRKVLTFLTKSSAQNSRIPHYGHFVHANYTVTLQIILNRCFALGFCIHYWPVVITGMLTPNTFTLLRKRRGIGPCLHTAIVGWTAVWAQNGPELNSSIGPSETRACKRHRSRVRCRQATLQTARFLNMQIITSRRSS